MADEAPPPHMPNLFSTHQEHFESVPIVTCDISLGLDEENGYIDCLRRKKRREFAISPFHVNGGVNNIPVTPLDNPRTRLSSHHIIRIINGLRGRYRVDLFIRDSDSYFLAFRREIILTEEEIQQGKVGGWGRWHRFSNAVVPAFLNARDIGISFSYGESNTITTGGPLAFDDILYTFGGFNDDSVAGWNIQRASYRVMTLFCEATRLRSVLIELRRRSRNGAEPAILIEALWSKIKKWGRLGEVILTGRRDNLLGLEVILPAWCQVNHGLVTMNDLIGANGEIMLIKHNPKLMGLTVRQLKALEGADGAGNAPEPGFQ